MQSRRGLSKGFQERQQQAQQQDGSGALGNEHVNMQAVDHPTYREGHHPTPQDVLQMQRHRGNKAVRKLLAHSGQPMLQRQSATAIPDAIMEQRFSRDMQSLFTLLGKRENQSHPEKNRDIIDMIRKWAAMKDPVRDAKIAGRYYFQRVLRLLVISRFNMLGLIPKLERDPKIKRLIGAYAPTYSDAPAAEGRRSWDNNNQARQSLLNRAVGRQFPKFYIEWRPPLDPASRLGTLFIRIMVDYTVDYKGFNPAQLREERAKEAAFLKQFHSDFQRVVHDAWSGKHRLSCDTAGLKDIQANVQVEVIRAPSRATADHYITIEKSPPGSKKFRSFVNGNTARLDWRDATESDPMSGHLRPDKIWRVTGFELNKADVNGEVYGILNNVVLPELQALNEAQSGRRGSRGQFIVVGRGSTSGESSVNAILAEQRANAVAAFLQKQASWLRHYSIFTRSAGERGSRFHASSRRVDILYYKNQVRGQNIRHVAAPHEAGHMFGLGDEYIDHDEKRVVADKPSHYDDVVRVLGKAEAEKTRVFDSDSMMSKGTTILPAHYVPFIDALNSLTMLKWTIR